MTRAPTSFIQICENISENSHKSNVAVSLNYFIPGSDQILLQSTTHEFIFSDIEQCRLLTVGP